MDKESSANEVVEASRVYLLMSSDYRISRNTRALWYFSHLNTVIDFEPRAHIGEFEEELGVLSILARDVGGSEYVVRGRCKCLVTAGTIVTFIAKRYRVVFVLDISPSVATIDLETPQVLYDEIFTSLEKMLHGLVSPLHIPGSSFQLQPQLCVTVIAHTPLSNCKANQILVQGWLTTRANVDDLLAKIEQRLANFEQKVASALLALLDAVSSSGNDEEGFSGGLFEDIVEKPASPDLSLFLTTPDVNFVNMFRYGILALQLLPEEAASVLVLLTDGVVGVPETSLFQSLLSQLRHFTISCSVVLLGGGGVQGGHCLIDQARRPFGQLPYPDLLRFITAVTFGVFFSQLPHTVTLEENVYHDLLVWSFQKPLQETSHIGFSDCCYHHDPTHKSLGACDRCIMATQMLCKRHSQKNLATPITKLISCRLREGYTIHDVSLNKGDTQIEVNLLLPWRDGIRIHYQASSIWPLSAAKRITHVEVSTQAHYNFLHDAMSMKKLSSPYRTALVKKYWQTLQGISETDELLIHLQSFCQNSVHYTIPESVRKGVPLFYLPPNSNNPQVNKQLSPKDTVVSQFAAFWKPVLMLDINVWQKWMHTHRVCAVLRHDAPLGKYVHIANTSGRYHTVFCRHAHAALLVLLQDVCSFQLLEAHSYICLIQPQEGAPSSFYVLRVASKPPCVVLRIAFLGGTPGQLRNQIVAELRTRLSALSLPSSRGSSLSAGSQKETKQQAADKARLAHSTGSSPKADRPCVTVFRKPIDKILIRYERMPREFLSLRLPLACLALRPLSGVASANQTATSVLATLSRYLCHRRWVWSVQPGTATLISMAAVGRILNTLTRIRLEEGFSFAHASSGIINMVLEVQMKVSESDDVRYPCVLQYIIFPPHTTTTRESASDEDAEEVETTEADGELQIVTECWVEPQEGSTVCEGARHRHLDGLDYERLSEALFPIDFECISSILTFEHLRLVCESPCLVAEACLTLPRTLSLNSGHLIGSDSRIQQVPFAFDLLRLLPKCQRVELLFSTCLQDGQPSSRRRRRRTTGGSSSDCSGVTEARTANALLFTFLLDGVRRQHNREVQLSEDQCQRVSALLLHAPLPAPGAGQEGGLKRSRSTDAGDVGHRQWCCFVRAVGGTHIVISFVPATYDDLRVLSANHNVVPSTSNELVSQPESAEKSPMTEQNGEGPPAGVTGGGAVTPPVPPSPPDDPATGPPTDHPFSSESNTLSVPSEHSGATSPGASPGPPPDSQLRLPIYVFNCPLGPLTDQLVADCQTADSAADISEDLTFPADDRQSETEGLPKSTGMPCREASGGEGRSAEGCGLGRRGSEGRVLVRRRSSGRQSCSECDQAGRQWMMCSEAEKVALYGDQDELRLHCTQLAEIFLRCFVKAVFESLRQGAPVSQGDLIAAIENMCEETAPLELDATRFVQSVCGHVRRWTCARRASDDLRGNLTADLDPDLDVDREDSLPDPSGGATVTSTQEEQDVFIDKLAPGQFFALSLLRDGSCEHSPGLHTLIRAKFDSIMQQFFKPVTSSPDYYFYCPQTFHEKRLSLESERLPMQEADVDFKMASDTSDIFLSGGNVETEDSERDSVISIADSGTLSSLVDDAEALVSAEEDTRDDDEVTPLFICLTCSVRSPDLQSIPVRSLPICLEDLLECLSDGPCTVMSDSQHADTTDVTASKIDGQSGSQAPSAAVKQSVNLREMRITLDITCLTLPPETDRPPLVIDRLVSFTSQMSHTSTSPPPSDDPNMSLHNTDYGLHGNMNDPLDGLPHYQQQAVMNVKEQIEWLLRDEIASALRLITPVTAATLELVANHVRARTACATCMHENVRLQFVFRPQDSLMQFIKDFERMSLPGYHLSREGEYYYLHLNRIHAHTIARVSAISSALKHLRTAPPSGDGGESKAAAESRTDDGGEGLKTEEPEDGEGVRVMDGTAGEGGLKVGRLEAIDGSAGELEDTVVSGVMPSDGTACKPDVTTASGVIPIDGTAGEDVPIGGTADVKDNVADSEFRAINGTNDGSGVSATKPTAGDDTIDLRSANALERQDSKPRAPSEVRRRILQESWAKGTPAFTGQGEVGDLTAGPPLAERIAPPDRTRDAGKTRSVAVSRFTVSPVDDDALRWKCVEDDAMKKADSVEDDAMKKADSVEDTVKKADSVEDAEKKADSVADAMKKADSVADAMKKADSVADAVKCVEDAMKKADSVADVMKKADSVEDAVKADSVEDAVKKADSVEDTVKKADSVEDAVKKADSVEDAEKKADSVEDAVKKADSIEDAVKKADSVEDAEKKADSVEDAVKKADSVEDTVKKADSVEDAEKKADSVEDAEKKADSVEDAVKKADSVEDAVKKADSVEDAEKKADSVEDAVKKADSVANAVKKADTIADAVKCIEDAMKKADSVADAVKKADSVADAVKCVEDAMKKADSVADTVKKADSVADAMKKADSVEDAVKADNVADAVKKAGSVSCEGSRDAGAGTGRSVAPPGGSVAPPSEAVAPPGDGLTSPDAAHTDDIRISITRPSPVRQLGASSRPPGARLIARFSDDGNLGAAAQPAAAAAAAAVRRRHHSGESVLGRTHAICSSHSLQLMTAADNRDVTRVQAISERAGHQGARPGGVTHSPASRSRHQSGLQTPMSTSLVDTTSSRSSVGEEGYEGDSSDSDEAGAMMSFSDSLLHPPVLPNFWLIMRIDKDCVEVYFHTRSMEEDVRIEECPAASQPASVEHHTQYKQVIQNIRAICRTVNQRLLLQELYDTRVCSRLLVPADDADLHWDDREATISNRRHADEIDDADRENYLAAEQHFVPGHFMCECKWQTCFELHPRLKLAPGHTVVSRGMQALRSILNTFSVTNRKNMFAIKDSKESVFYIRLNESSPEHSTLFSSECQRADLESALSGGTFSRSSSLLSIPMRKSREADDDFINTMAAQRSRRLSSADWDSEMTGLISPSIRSSTCPRRDSSITLLIYGICPVSLEIGEALMQMLQKKLDDAVLDVLSMTLGRNPMCKLNPSDVHFIQPPLTAPTTLRLTIPVSALLHQHALAAYLRQTLLQFCYTPKFTNPDCVFRTYDLPPAGVADGRQGAPLVEPIVESDVLLYNTPQQYRAKGIACMHLSFVDGRGNPVHLLGCPKPPSLSYKDAIDRTMFDGLIHTSVYEGKAGSKYPGPAALIQLHIWQRGDVDLPQLTQRVMAATRHAVADIVTEYRLLTAPLCEVPEHYSRGVDSPLHSAPPSPGHAPELRSVAAGQSGRPTLQTCEASGKTPKEKSSFSFQSFMSRMTSGGSGRDPAKTDTPMTLSAPEVEDERRKEAELWHKIDKYERGLKGVLQPLFCGPMQEWLRYCISIGSPSVSVIKRTLSTRFPIDYVLRELQTIVTEICHDSNVKVFRQLDSSPGDAGAIYLPYTPTRTPVSSQDAKSESSLDLGQFSQNVPGRSANFVVIGRNIDQWRSSIDYQYGSGTVPVSEPPLLMHPKTHKSYQRFQPIQPDAKSQNSPEKAESSSPGGSFVNQCNHAFVPRQRLLLMDVFDKEFTIYTYNWSVEVHGQLQRLFSRLIHWHNARSHFLASVVCRKMGLLQQNLFTEAPLDPHNPEPNPFIQGPPDPQSLVKCTAPPQVQRAPAQLRSRSGSGVGHAPPSVGPRFGELPMQLSSYRHLRDPVHRHGAQWLERSSKDRTEFDEQMKLENLFMIWQQRMGPSQMPIEEDSLMLLKDSSRLLHNVATQMLFCASWRRTLGRQTPSTGARTRHGSQNSTDKSRSRHGSGASVKSRRSDHADLRKRSVGFDSPEVVRAASSASPQGQASEEEGWHIELRKSFVSQYIQYLQRLGFVQVQTKAPSPRKTVRMTKLTTEKKLTNIGHAYLQKTLPGGIMLIELGFREVYFCINVYALECSRIPFGKNVNPQLAVIFTDECDKFKDLTHVHSFSHDFHLRALQAHLGPRARHQPSSPLNTAFNVTAFLTDFVRHFPYAPSFARSRVSEGTLTISDINSSGVQLFAYMLQHHKLYSMHKVRIAPDDDSTDMVAEEVLVTQLACRGGATCGGRGEGGRVQMDSYDIGLVIAHDWQMGVAETTLALRYWVVLTQRDESFPKLKLEKKLGIHNSGLTKVYPATGFRMSWSSHDFSDVGWFDSPNGESRSGEAECGQAGDSERINYLGYSNSDQAPIYSLLLTESNRAKQKIDDMVRSSMAQCRRDILWERLLRGEADDAAGRRKHRSDPDDSKYLAMARLGFIEFEELLNFVTRVSLRDIDATLVPLHHMSMAWYRSLIKVLRTKYAERHRYFSLPDASVQYVVAICEQNNPDILMMLAVDSQNSKVELCAVHREHHQQMTSTETDLATIAGLNHVETFVNACCFHIWSGIL